MLKEIFMYEFMNTMKVMAMFLGVLAPVFLLILGIAVGATIIIAIIDCWGDRR